MYLVVVKNGQSIRVNGVIYVGGQVASMSEIDFRVHQAAVELKGVLSDKEGRNPCPMTKDLFQDAVRARKEAKE